MHLKLSVVIAVSVKFGIDFLCEVGLTWVFRDVFITDALETGWLL